MGEPISTIVVTGLPGAGKTRFALALAGALIEAGDSALVLHTDILKVTARDLDPDAPRGPGYDADSEAKAAWLRPHLQAQAAKAQQDGYRLIVEGTMALGFRPAHSLCVAIQVHDSERRRRCARKHPSAARSLAGADLSGFAARLAGTPADLVLDGARPPSELAAQTLRRVSR